ncbi:hypothetical protein [Clostridium sp. BNL1100]|uniref:hypothetical protein n=1 Tax=Clostridium sp. BNL1100 TaxID=755731 RepID=UPI00024A7A98|nr:hypothetical protein [Clostridium sp. BNL1100]AEY66608.1 hypothetical protein Clo1100_2437 [Clostridium sp. BNL1100]
MFYILGTISSIICILLGFWLGKGCPLPKQTKHIDNITSTNEQLLEQEKQQEEYERQFQNLMKHSGEL